MLDTPRSLQCRTEGKNELRRQVGNLRFDLNVLIDTLPKAARKDANASKVAFYKEIEALDNALTKKNQATAAAKLETSKAALDSLIAKLS